MIRQNPALCYACLAAIVAVGHDCPTGATAAIFAVALSNNPGFWGWAAGIRDLTFRGWRIRRQ